LIKTGKQRVTNHQSKIIYQQFVADSEHLERQ